MGKDKIQMPSSQGGLVRYFDEYKSKITLKPMQVIVILIIVILLLVLLHSIG